jgi:N-acetylmuramoyl-L-alanine amidase
MNIKNHLLYDDNGKQVPFYNTPNKGRKYTPQYLVMHFTAATTAKSSINWFLNKDAKASAHLLIDSDGSISQFAPFDVITWHAGKSQWNGLDGLNQYSIGIEIVNGGRLRKSGNSWICPVDMKVVPEDDIVQAKHKNEAQPDHWHEYTPEQIEAAIQISTLLVKIYGLKDVIGHDDISPLRKSDPGPAFPLSSVRARAMGRKDESIDNYITSTEVNIRSGAGTSFNTLTKSALPKNTKVQVLKREGNWSFVEVQQTIESMNDLEGWIFSKYLLKS